MNSSLAGFFRNMNERKENSHMDPFKNILNNYPSLFAPERAPTADYKKAYARVFHKKKGNKQK